MANDSQSIYILEICDPNGTRRGQIDDFWSLSYRKEVNAPGWVRFSCDGNHPKLALLQEWSQINVRRRDPIHGIDWYEDFTGFYRKYTYHTPDVDYFESEMPGPMSMLNWRVNAYPAAQANKSQFTSKPVETIGKTLVTNNFTATATTGNGRVRNGALAGPFTLVVATNQARGTSIDRQNSGVRILKELSELGQTYGGDWGMTRTGPAQWTLEYFPGQLGADVHTTVVFTTDRSNMVNPTYTWDAIEEKTVAIVAGPDQKTKRQFRVRTRAGRWSTTNDIELWVDAKNEQTSAGQDAAGDKALRDNRVKQDFKFTAKTSDNTVYKRDFDLGYLVGAYYKGISLTQKVWAVTVEYDPSTGKETISPEIGDP